MENLLGLEDETELVGNEKTAKIIPTSTLSFKQETHSRKHNQEVSSSQPNCFQTVWTPHSTTATVRQSPSHLTHLFSNENTRVKKKERLGKGVIGYICHWHTSIGYAVISCN